MQYDIKAAADELMLSVNDLKEIYDLYFIDSAEMVRKCEEALKGKDHEAAAKSMHALKGASSNLRIEKLTGLAREAEEAIKNGRTEKGSDYLRDIRRELNLLEIHIGTFYKQGCSQSSANEQRK